MSPLDVIRWAGREGIDLNVRNGRLFVRAPGTIAAALVAALRAHKPAILRALAAWPDIATVLTVTLDRCQPLTPEVLTAAERMEAETLARDLAQSGGLGQFVICLTGNWNLLTERDRMAGVLVWQLALIAPALESVA